MTDPVTGGSVTRQRGGHAVWRIVAGTPTDEELAALVGVLAGLTARGGGEPAPVPRSRWADPAAGMRAPLFPGPGAWRASGLPR